MSHFFGISKLQQGTANETQGRSWYHCSKSQGPEDSISVFVSVSTDKHRQVASLLYSHFYAEEYALSATRKKRSQSLVDFFFSSSSHSHTIMKEERDCQTQ